MRKGLPKHRRAWRNHDGGLRWGAESPFAHPSPALSGRWLVSGENFVCAPFPGFAGIGGWLPVDFLPSDCNPAVLLCSSLSALWCVY